MPSPDDNWLCAFLAAEAVVLVTAVLACRRMARCHGVANAAAVFALRAVLMGLLAALFVQVFRGGRPPQPGRDTEAGESRHIVVLQDDSASMSLKSAKGVSRAGMAEDVWTRVRDAVGTRGGQTLQLTRMRFAENLVADTDAARLRPDATRLANAFVQTLLRTRPDALLVVSDGVSTDGPVPGYVLNWAANRRVPVFAVCCDVPDEVSSDLAVRHVGCQRVNPRRLTASVTAVGPLVPQEFGVTLSIDNARIGETAMAAGADASVFFPVSELQDGWHEYAVAVRPVYGEVTDLNNVRRGVFLVSARRLLFLYHLPRAENATLVRFLRREFADRVTCMQTQDEALPGVNPAGLCLLIAGDASPDAVPPDIMTAVQRRRLPCLVLAGTHFAQWDRKRLPHCPVLRHTGVIRTGMADDADRSARIVPSPRVEAFKGLDFSQLPLNLLYGVEPAEPGGAAVCVETGQAPLPLLLADSLKQPRCLVVTADTTWKWARHPDAAVRRGYEQFWRAVFAWAGAALPADEGLSLEFQDDPQDPAVTTVFVRPMAEAGAEPVSEVTLSIAEGAVPTRVRLTPAPGGFEYRYAHQGSGPQVVWFQAEAQHGAGTVASARKPLLLKDDSPELDHRESNPALLQALTAGIPSHFAHYAEAGRLVEQLLDSLRRDVEPASARRERDPRMEILLAALILLTVGVEWLLEQNLQRRTRTE